MRIKICIIISNTIFIFIVVEIYNPDINWCGKCTNRQQYRSD